MSKLDTLSEKAKPLAEKFLSTLDSLGIEYNVLETRRRKEVQEAYFAQGREKLDKVNELRKKAGLYLISDLENRNKITWTLASKHLDGDAMDIVPILNGKIPWSVTSQSIADAWLRIGSIGESCGFNWGGRWKPIDKFGCGKDLPHFEV